MAGSAAHPMAESTVIGVLALQGSFPLHMAALESAGARARAVTKPDSLEGIRGLIIPGGESTVMSRLAGEYGLFEPLRELARGGLPMMGTCAGAILLGCGDDPARLEVVDVAVERNAYGRQVDSFSASLALEVLESPFHGVFIRAPKFRVSSAGSARVLGCHQGDPVCVQQGSVLLTSFHPELTSDLRLHRYFLSLCDPQT